MKPKPTSVVERLPCDDIVIDFVTEVEAVDHALQEATEQGQVPQEETIKVREEEQGGESEDASEDGLLGFGDDDEDGAFGPIEPTMPLIDVIVGTANNWPRTLADIRAEIRQDLLKQLRYELEGMATRAEREDN